MPGAVVVLQVCKLCRGSLVIFPCPYVFPSFSEVAFLMIEASRNSDDGAGVLGKVLAATWEATKVLWPFLVPRVAYGEADDARTTFANPWRR